MPTPYKQMQEEMTNGEIKQGLELELTRTHFGVSPANISSLRLLRAITW